MYVKLIQSKPVLLVFLTLIAGLLIFLGLHEPHNWGIAASISDISSNICDGFAGNTISDGVNSATIAGGGSSYLPNMVTKNMGSIGGGAGNTAGEMATVSGGFNNIAETIRTTVSGGAENRATDDGATIGGGRNNLVQGEHATIAGGLANEATQGYATIAGGSGNKSMNRHATVGGGTSNRAAGYATTTSGGMYNKAQASYSTISGGIYNFTHGFESSIGGGSGNKAAGEAAVISGGMNNKTTDNYSIIGGGRSNTAGNQNTLEYDSAYATVAGGLDNMASGTYSAIPGGRLNTAAGQYSFAVGHRAKITKNHNGSMLFSDSLNYDFVSITDNEFAARSTGGFRVCTSIDKDGKTLSGAQLSAGGGSWETLSDENVKQNLSPVSTGEILELIVKLHLFTWSYKAQDSSIRHIGPMAGDFFDLFQMGSDRRYISTVDADGVTLGAVQGLYQIVQQMGDKVRTQDREIQTLQTMIQHQQNQIKKLIESLQRLEIS